MGIAAIKTEVDSYLTALHPTLVSKLGDELRAEHDLCPRIVWVPTADRFAPAKLHKTEPRPVRTRVAGCAAHIWGDSLASTETLVNNFIAALHQTAYGNYEIVSGQWVDPGKMTKGRAYVVEFTVEIPVTIPVPANSSVTVTAVPQNTGMVFPDGSTVSGTPGV